MPVSLNLRALVLSTTPPFPRDYGNRNRVFQLIEFLKRLGYTISFVLYPFDEDWRNGIPETYRDLVDYFEYFCVVPNTRELHLPAQGRHHEIDEWWDENIGVTLEWLFKRSRFDVFVVNYTFLSKAFLFAPKGVSKILETHDAFTGRREAFEANGVEPEFFYTTAERERIAFDRADLVIAIKDSEAREMAERTCARVIAIPYWDMTAPPVQHRERPQPLQFNHDRPLRIGFIGAQNSVNIVNLNRFLAKFARWVRLYNAPLRVVVAGNVCRGLTGDWAFVDKLGRVEKIDDFYNQVDLVVAPLEFSTGIKIKVGEALAWDKPIVGTANAFDGYRIWRQSQSLPDTDAVCDCLVGLSYNEAAWEDLVLDARRAARSARSAQEHGFQDLQAWLRGRARRIAVVTTRPLWRRDTLIDEYLAHIVEYLSYLGKVVVISSAPGPADASRIFAQVDYFCVEPSQLQECLETLNAALTLTAVFLDPYAQADGAALPPVPVWRLELGGVCGANTGAARLRGLAHAPTISVSVLRYAPVSGLEALDDGKALVIVAEEADAWRDAVLDYVLATAQAHGLAAETARAPAAFETSPAAFLPLARHPARRVVLIGPSHWFEYVAQIAGYRRQSCLMLSRERIVPSAFHEDGESLAEAVRLFFEENRSAAVSADQDTGWDRIWNSLANES